MQDNCFVIFSYGRTATQWIANALSSQPEILCAHGFDLAPERKDEGHFERIRRIDREARLSRVDPQDLDGYFAIIKSDAHKIHGNIHGLSPLRYLQNPSAFSGHYRCAQITRHPIHRALSFTGRRRYVLENNFRVEENKRQMMNVPSSLVRHGLEPALLDGLGEHEAEVLMWMLYVLDNDYDQLQWPLATFRYEDITQDPGVREQFLTAVLEDSGLVDRVLDYMRSSPTIDSQKERAPDAVPARLLDIFNIIADKNGLTEIYGRYGY